MTEKLREDQVDDSNMIWPTFYVVGAAKCGTTSVWQYLKQHPQVFLPEMKEPCFFASAPVPPNSEKRHCPGNREVYKSLYQKANGYLAIGDASTRYLWDPDVPARIHEVAPQARIVIVLRDPVERAYSHFSMFNEKGTGRSTFLETIQLPKSDIHSELFPQRIYVDAGLYYESVLRYFETFGREQVGIYFFDDLEKDTMTYMSAICRHIGVDPSLLDRKELARANLQGITPRAKWLYKAARAVLSRRLRRSVFPPSVREWMGTSPLLYKRYTQPRDDRATKYLQSIYEPDLCRLEELLGRKLPQLRRSWI
jgi:hypothetical protein